MRQGIAPAVIGFIEGKLSAADLREILVANSWNLPVTASKEDQELIGEIELALSEYEAGHISRNECSRRIAPFFAGLLNVGSAAGSIMTGAQMRAEYLRQWMVAEDIRPSLELLSGNCRAA